MCYIDGCGGIEIGDNVSIAHSTSIVSFNHTYEKVDIPIKYNPISCGYIYIYNDFCSVYNDVWIGCGVRILSGVTIGNRSIVAAGSVVTANVTPYTLVGGIPAKFIKQINN